ncbi:MAG: DNA recombination protein RmuC [Balneolaceae bacterium]|nr:MAG: DNA recombination protein RmuC [Balneolaceae bacterium]
MGLVEVGIAVFFLIIGFLLAYFMAKAKESKLEERIANLSAAMGESQVKLESVSARAADAEKELTLRTADLKYLKERLTDQKQEVEKLQEQFRFEFKHLANEILEEKSKKFTEQNKEKLDQLLKPLGEKITEFQKRVEDTHREDLKGRSALDQHLKMLQEMNQKMSTEAKNLTKALKGDTKQQGNWGEVILQRILEKSGLRKGFEYTAQESFTSEDGRRSQPDVIVSLPDEKKLVIDSKVSLTAYEKYSSTEDTDETQAFLKQHIASLRAHVKNLSSKNYEQIHGFKSPDFVLLFIPIEPAFTVAMQNDQDLYNEAFERNIIIVSPTTLLATLATIQNVWKQEYQNRNAMEIARRGGLLYDKFVGFVDNLKDVGKRIRQTEQAYDSAMNQLSDGAGNLVGQAEKLRELGANASKKLQSDISKPALETFKKEDH